MLVTTHYMDEAERCTQVGYIFMSQLLAVGKPEELRKLPHVTPPGTHRYDLLVPSPTQQLAVLRRHKDVLDATLFGEHLHLLVSDELNSDDLLEELQVQPEDVEIREVAPSLEDVFVSLTK